MSCGHGLTLVNANMLFINVVWSRFFARGKRFISGGLNLITRSLSVGGVGSFVKESNMLTYEHTWAPHNLATLAKKKRLLTFF